MGIFSGLAQFAGAGSWSSFRDNYITGIGVARHLGFMKKPLAPNFSVPQASPHMFKAEITTQKIIYGKMRTSGPLYRVGATGANHMYSHIIIPLAGHELDSIGNIYVNTKLISGTALLPNNPTPAQQWRYDQDVLSLKQYENHIRVKRHHGGLGQVVDPDLLAELEAWKSTNVGKGIAYMYVRFKFSAALFPNGIENVQADVRGAKVFDPRNQSIAWSDNWALCMRDYLTADYGMGLTDAEINDAYTIASANISQQVIPTANGGSQNRYTLNGVVDTKNKVTDNIKKMLTAGAGNIVPVIEGQCRIIAGAFPAASDITVTITESDIISSIDYQPHAPRNGLFNTVTGSYAGEESGWKKLTYPQVGATYPPQVGAITPNQAAVAADGRIIRKVIDLPYSTDHERCQRLSALVINQHRASGILKISCKATVKEIAAFEVINVKIPALWTGSKTFRVADFTNKVDFTVDLVLHEDNADIYNWNQSDAAVFVPIPPQVINAGATVVQPGIPVRVNGLELNGQGNNTEFTGGDAHFVWRHTTSYDFQNIGSEIFGAGSGGFDAWFMGYEITVLDPAGNTIRTDFTKDNWYDFTFLKNAYITGGPYRAFTIEVRIKGQQNQLSQPAKLSVSNPAPALPTGLATIPSFDNIHITFIRPTDLDFAGVEVYLSTVSGFVPDASTLVVTGNSNDILLPGLISGTTYYIRIKPFDAFGKSGTNISGEIAVTATAVSGMVIEPGSLDYITLAPTIVTNIQAVPGAITTAQNAQATANGASSSASTAQIAANGAAAIANSAQVTANGASSSASTALVATADINGKLAASYSVRLKVGTNAVVGFGLTDGTGITSSFDVIAGQFRLADANGNFANAAFSVDALGNAEFAGNLKAAGGTFTGALSAVAGTFTGSVNTGSYTGYAWPLAGQSGAHMSSSGLLLGNFTSGGKYFQVYTPASGDAAIYTNIQFISGANISASGLDLTGAGQKFTVRGSPLVKGLTIATGAVLTHTYLASGPSQVSVIAKSSVGATGGSQQLWINGVLLDASTLQNTAGVAASIVTVGEFAATYMQQPVVLELRFSGAFYSSPANIVFNVTEVLT